MNIYDYKKCFKLSRGFKIKWVGRWFCRKVVLEKACFFSHKWKCIYETNDAAESKMTTSSMKHSLGLQQKLPSIFLPRKHHSLQINFQHKETKLPIRPPKGNQPGARQSVWLSSLETKSKVFPPLFLLFCLGEAWEKSPLLLFISAIVFYLISGHLSLCALLILQSGRLFK